MAIVLPVSRNTDSYEQSSERSLLNSLTKVCVLARILRHRHSQRFLCRKLHYFLSKRFGRLPMIEFRTKRSRITFKIFAVPQCPQFMGPQNIWALTNQDPLRGYWGLPGLFGPSWFGGYIWGLTMPMPGKQREWPYALLSQCRSV